MKKVFLIVILLAIGGSVAYIGGCGPRIGVVKDKIVSEIDKVLGELNVKEKDIDQKMAKLKPTLRDINEQRIRTEVRLEQLQKKSEKNKDELAEVDGKLVKIREIMGEFSEEQDSIERNGKTYTKSDVNKMAEELIARRTGLTGDLANAINVSIAATQQSLDFLTGQENAAKKAMDDLESKLRTLKEKKEAIDTIRQSSSITSEQTSIMTKIEEITKSIDDLDVDIETAMRVETEKMKEATSQNMKVDDLLAEPEDLNSTMNKIDEILGKSGGN
ncbi:MAG: hypothetical protein R3C03_13975 [Pirellulaceae bacterium]